MKPTSHAARGGFPATRYSVLEAVASGDAAARAAAYDTLVGSYWKPVYKYLRVKWRAMSEEAEDLTQEFFLRAVEKGFLAGYDPAEARFRTFVRVCVDRFASNQLRAERRLKRGGGMAPCSLDFAGAEEELHSGALTSELGVEEFFQREWQRCFFEAVVAALERRCAELGKSGHFRLFERYDLEPAAGQERPSYAELARAAGLPVTQVTNHLAWTRREFRRLALEHLRAVTVSEQELRSEARALLGVELP